MEEWRPIAGFEGKYEVSNLGRVRSLTLRGKPRAQPFIMRDHLVGLGYRGVFLYQDGEYTTRYVHRAVLDAFVGPPFEGAQAAHIDGSRDNNVLENLMWATVAENASHRIDHGTHNRGEKNPVAVLTEAQVSEIRRTCVRGSREVGTWALSRKYGVSQGHISDIVNGKRWVHSVAQGDQSSCSG